VHPGGWFRLACLKGADVSKNQKDPSAGLRYWPQPSPNHLPEHCLTCAQKAEMIPSPALSHKEKRIQKVGSRKYLFPGFYVSAFILSMTIR